jgi:hypothetical protein
MIFIPIHLEDKVSLPDFLIVVPGVIYKTLSIFITRLSQFKCTLVAGVRSVPPIPASHTPSDCFYCIMRSLTFTPLPGSRMYMMHVPATKSEPVFHLDAAVFTLLTC